MTDFRGFLDRARALKRASAKNARATIAADGMANSGTPVGVELSFSVIVVSVSKFTLTDADV